MKKLYNNNNINVTSNYPRLTFYNYSQYYFTCYNYF